MCDPQGESNKEIKAEISQCSNQEEKSRVQPKNGNVYEAKKNGRGKEFNGSSEGLKYCGEWRNNVMNGKGALYHPNGKLKSRGLFKDGKLDTRLWSFNCSENGRLMITPQIEASLEKRQEKPNFFLNIMKKMFVCGSDKLKTNRTL